MRPEIRKSIIRSVLKGQPASAATLPDAIDEALAAAEEILEARRVEHAALEAEYTMHRETVAAIETECRAAKAKCRHWCTSADLGFEYEPPLTICEICCEALK